MLPVSGGFGSAAKATVYPGFVRTSIGRQRCACVVCGRASVLPCGACPSRTRRHAEPARPGEHYRTSRSAWPMTLPSKGAAYQAPVLDGHAYYPIIIAAERSGGDYCVGTHAGDPGSLSEVDWRVLLRDDRVCDPLDPRVLPVVHAVVDKGDLPIPGEITRTASSPVTWSSAQLPASVHDLAFMEVVCKSAPQDGRESYSCTPLSERSLPILPPPLSQAVE